MDIIIETSRLTIRHFLESDIGFYDEGELIEVSNSMISARNDGIDYIYEVYAIWNEGNSHYVFRLSMSGE